MNKELPVAVVTVPFDKHKQPVTGEQIAALVQQVVGSVDGRYMEERRFYDGDMLSFGQTSKYPYGHIRVVPTLDDLPYFRPEESYLEVKVTSHSWGGEVYAIGYGQDSVIAVVKQFAADLASAYQVALSGSFPSYSQPQDDPDGW